MKRINYLLSIFAVALVLFSCGKDEPQPAGALAGTKYYSAHYDVPAEGADMIFATLPLPDSDDVLPIPDGLYFSFALHEEENVFDSDDSHNWPLYFDEIKYDENGAPIGVENDHFEAAVVGNRIYVHFSSATTKMKGKIHLLTKSELPAEWEKNNYFAKSIEISFTQQ